MERFQWRLEQNQMWEKNISGNLNSLSGQSGFVLLEYILFGNMLESWKVNFLNTFSLLLVDDCKINYF